MTADEQAFWDAAALAALGPLMRASDIGGQKSAEVRVQMAAVVADELLAERRKRAPASPSEDTVRCEFCRQREKRSDASSWTRTSRGVEGLVCWTCVMRRGQL